MKIALVVIAVAALVALAWAAGAWGSTCREAPARAGVVLRAIEDPADRPRVGGRAPDFEWVTSAGAARRLSELRGRPVIVNFWATWCRPCREEMPALDRAAAAADDLVVIALDLDESALEVDCFIESYKLRQIEPVIDAGKKITTRYGVVSLPTTIFVGPDGIVRHLEIRPVDEAVIRAGLERSR